MEKWPWSAIQELKERKQCNIYGVGFSHLPSPTQPGLWGFAKCSLHLTNEENQPQLYTRANQRGPRLLPCCVCHVAQPGLFLSRYGPPLRTPTLKGNEEWGMSKPATQIPDSTCLPWVTHRQVGTLLRVTCEFSSVLEILEAYQAGVWHLTLLTRAEENPIPRLLLYNINREGGGAAGRSSQTTGRTLQFLDMEPFGFSVSLHQSCLNEPSRA